ncbi:CHAT domain-containing protein [Actinoplanes couchii]|uniref:CHAT domain-containing protein n=1 Tax=Actinoplanes couchii TaxID=403638 RepID=A0ABQ3XEK5_9ACTN|nr:CHAT domain-containing protein [Actinoplanes couchii]MDR6319811.1 tetratricopeptide (TPR) repeat protein [Actinoplanes couchii]GID56946.1 CHAT domain-containing protein [Actinoplanes couchii]
MDVSERIDLFTRTGDSSVVDGLDALRDAAGLLRDSPGETEAAGLLFWHRFTTRPGTPAGDADLSTMFALVARPGTVPPDWFRTGLTRHWDDYQAWLRANTGGQQEALDQALALLTGGVDDVSTADLTAATDRLRHAVRFISWAHPATAETLAHLGNLVLHCFLREGDPALLDEGERIRRESLALAFGDDTAWALSQLIDCLAGRPEYDRDTGALAECAELGRRLATAPVTDPQVRLALTRHSGLRLFTLARDHDDPASAQAAAELLQVAWETDAGRDVDVARECAEGFREAFRLIRHPSWIRNAVYVAREARAAEQVAGRTSAQLLGTLCAALVDYAQAEPYGTNLQEAVQAGVDACTATPEDDPLRGPLLHELARAYYATAVQDGGVPYASAAMLTAAQAFNTLKPGHHRRGLALHLAAAAQHERWRRTGRIDDLRGSIALTRESVQMDLPATTAADQLGSLASALCDLAAIEDDVALVREAHTVAEQAVDRDPASGAAHLALGRALQALHVFGAASADDARGPFLRACLDDSLPVSVRITADRGLAWTYLQAGTPMQALPPLMDAITLLSELSSMVMWRGDRQRALAGVSGLAGEAASAAIAAGEPALAVELLERARGTLLTETMDRRGLGARITAADPELGAEYARFLEILELLDNDPEDLVVIEMDLSELSDTDRQYVQQMQGPSAGGRAAGFSYPGMYADLQRERRQAETELGELLDRARSRPGLSGLLEPPDEDELIRQAAAGPIVLITTSRYGGDALLCTTDGIRSLPLPGADRRAVEEQAHLLAVAVDLDERRAGQQTITEVLGWIWDRITEPVLTALGHTGPPADGSEWPRIWWCPTGAATPLPLHAAGHHTDGSGRTVLDRVISAYTPTIGALRHARSVPVTGEPPDRLLVVAAPGTAVPLPRVRTETAAVQRLVPESVLVEDGDVEQVAAMLPDVALVHFACHYRVDPTDPDAGGLVLADGDGGTLTVGRVAKEHRPGAALAFLAACETVRGAEGLSDEPIHAVSAFQLAGFRHVIGTLWPVHDSAAAQITEAFYTRLTRGGTVRPDPESAAEALHHAVRGQRARHAGRNPSMWAAHVHSGG